MKTRIPITWPKLTADDTAKMFGITPERREEIRQIARDAVAEVEARHKAERAEKKAKKAKAA